MDFIELASSRRSIRGFDQKEVSDELLTQLIEAAQFAPSGGNCQPWHFYVIKNKEVLTQIHDRVYKADWFLSAPAVIVVCIDIARSEGRYKERGRNLYSIQDTAAAIQNILLCAQSLNIGTCWCGAFDETVMSEILSLQNDVRPVALIPLGYHSSNPNMPKRRPIEEIVTFIR